MKNLDKIILLAVFVVPIVICGIILRNIWSEDDETPNDNDNNDVLVSVSDPVYMSGDDIISGDDITNETSGDIRQLAGENFETKIGDPISKIYSDAEISAVIANAYLEADEQSEVVGKLDKHSKVTAQKFPDGWSRMTGTDSTGVTVAGWVRTDNISFPEDGTSTLNPNPSASTGVVTAEPYLNVRLNPSTTATILTTVNKGVTVTIIESSNGWHKITANGVTGWVSAAYIK